MASIFFGGFGEIFAQQTENSASKQLDHPTSEELQYQINQISGNLTEIKEIVSEIQEGKQCTVCQQQQQQEQNSYFKALLILTGATAGVSALSLVLYFRKFKGFGDLLAEIKKVMPKDGEESLGHIKDIKEIATYLKTAIDRIETTSSKPTVQGKIESLEGKISEIETKIGKDETVRSEQIDEIKNNIESLMTEIKDLEKRFEEIRRNLGAPTRR